jgi:hypothetical protein
MNIKYCHVCGEDVVILTYALNDHFWERVLTACGCVGNNAQHCDSQVTTKYRTFCRGLLP